MPPTHAPGRSVFCSPHLLLAMGVFVGAPGTRANGILRDGTGARAMALGGASVGLADGPLEALAANPAQLSLAPHTTIQVGGMLGWGVGEFSNVADPSGSLSEKVVGLPEFGISIPVAERLTLGLSAVPESALGVDWTFVDAPGGLGGSTTYGRRLHRSEILVHRSAAGFSYALTDTLSLGGSVGLVYNRNALRAPYVFQSHPVLRGFKTALDLETSGFGVDGSVGLLFRPSDEFTLSLAYRTAAHVESDGTAHGNAGTQLTNLGGAFAGVRPDFRYDALVETAFPQRVSGGVSWKAKSWLRLVGEVEWIHWSGAFDDLPIHLTNGNNADLNGFLGTNAIDDTVPLDWRDRVVVRAGAEFEMSDEIRARIGYAFGDNPVPSETLTPMTAAVVRHTLTAGAEWSRGRFSVAGAYQFGLPSEVATAASGLASGEYSASRTEVSMHLFGLTAGYRF